MRIYNELNGFINLLKPAGPTSSDMVTKLKRILNVKKIGHLGTLDPLAAGVLPIGIGKANRLFDHLTYKKKSYRAIFTFGQATDTADSDGVIIFQSDKIPSCEEIVLSLSKFRGEIMQTPPKYSALKINGQKAYELARRDVEFELKKRQVTIYKFDLVNQVNSSSFMFDIECSGGTYIRSLCTELAEELNTCGYMSMLIRTGSGEFAIKDSLTVEEIEKASINDIIIHMDSILKDLPRLDIESSNYKSLINGVPIVLDISDINKIAVYYKNELYGIGSINNHMLKINTYLKIDNK